MGLILFAWLAFILLGGHEPNKRKAVNPLSTPSSETNRIPSQKIDSPLSASLCPSLLRIRIKKGKDGPDCLTCIRPDGTSTWQRVQAFFPLHDLTHVAVETVLELTDGFYGLVAQGWDLENFSAPKAVRKPFPSVEVPFEDVVMGFQREHREGKEIPLEELNHHFSALPWPWTITSEQAGRIRALLRDLAEQWERVPVGESLEVPFPYRPVERF